MFSESLDARLRSKRLMPVLVDGDCCGFPEQEAAVKKELKHQISRANWSLH